MVVESFSMKKIVLLLALAGLFPLISVAQQDEEALALQLVRQNQSNIGLSAQDLKNAKVSSTYLDALSGTRLVYLQQTYQALPVRNTLWVLAFRNGKLVSRSGAGLPSLDKKTGGLRSVPKLSASEAVVNALKDRKLNFQRNPLVVSAGAGGQKVVFDNMYISREPITAELMWVPEDDGQRVFLCWEIYIVPQVSDDYWQVRINAMDGTTVGVSNLTVYCQWNTPDHVAHRHSSPDPIMQSLPSSTFVRQHPFFEYRYATGGTQPATEATQAPTLVNNASYRVIPYPAESPIHAGGAHALRTNPWTDAPGDATTLKWHNNGSVDYNITRGNNVWAQEDRNGNNGTGIPATSTTTGDPLTFDFTPNFTVTPTQTTPVPNQQFNITNLFYWNNIIHDISYLYGFDEVSGNFQASNLGRGGQQNDYVLADAQDGSGTNNANFATPSDGGSGRMQMYLWNGNPQKDGDVDNGIVSHEFAHGISNRLTGGPAQAGCLQNAEQMGEGWSDYFGLMYTQNWANSSLNTGFSTPRGIGTYASGQAATSVGIRSQRYCTNFLVNNRVYGANISAQQHDRGEIWCATLWDMTWNIINQVGSINPNIYDVNGGGGNTIALKLVMEGMKLQPCSPGFIDGRNAILQADQILFNGAHQCAIWEAFRRRGMGAFASQGSSGSVTDQVADYTLGSATLRLTQSVTEIPEGQEITFNNEVTTNNCAGITNFLLTDTLPLNVTYVSGGTYNASTRTVVFPVTVPAGQTQVYSFTVRVNAGSYYPTVTLFQDSANGPIAPTWIATSTTTGLWSLSTTRSFSAPSSYFSNNLDVQSDQILALSTSIPMGATPPNLTFRHWYNCESTYDGGVLEASTDAGTTWTDMQANILEGGYIATMDATTLLAGRRAWSGSSSNQFVRTKVNLTPYANQNLRIRFRFTTDVGTNLEGWYVDDIAIRNQAVVEIKSNLFTATNQKVATSDTFTIIIPASTCIAASITSAPTPVTVCAGSSATLTVTAAGTAPEYQWQMSTDGGSTWTDISGAGSNTLPLNNVSLSQNNYRYRVIVSNDCPSSVTSTAALLTVSSPATLNTQPQPQTTCAGNPVTFSANASGSNLGYQWQVSTDGGATFVNLPGETGSSLTLSSPSGSLSGNQYHLVITDCTPAGLVSANATLTVSEPASITTPPANNSACEGSPVTFSAVCSGTALTFQWQVSTDGGTTWTDIAGANSSQYTISSAIPVLDGNRYRVRVNGTDCPGEVISAAALLTVGNTATINASPSSTTACSGQSATFTVSAAGTGLTYQWQVSTDGGATWTDLSGETNATLTLNSVSAAQNGNQYRVQVSSACSATAQASAAAPLLVLTAPAITAQPAPVTLCVNGNATFSAGASGTGITYQWQVSADGGATWNDIPGETSPTLSLTGVTSSQDNQRYRVQVTSSDCGSLFSEGALLDVETPASITALTGNLNLCEGEDSVLTVSATGNGLSYQWQRSTDGGTNYSDIAGATASTYDLGAVTNSMSGNRYRVKISQPACGDILSTEATLTVFAAPTVSITASPSAVIALGQSIILTANSNPPAVSYQWFRNGSVVTGQTGNTLSVNQNALGNYTVLCTDNNGCSANSSSLNVRDTVLNYSLVSPNPNNGQFQVRYPGNPAGTASVFINLFDAKGARVYQKAYTVGTAYQIMDVDVRRLSRGTYMLTLTTSAGSTLATTKVVLD